MARPLSVRPTHPQTAELPGTLVRCHFSHAALRAAEDGATDLGPHTLTWYLLCTGSGQVLPACQLITGNCDHPRKLPPPMDLSIHPSSTIILPLPRGSHSFTRFSTHMGLLEMNSLLFRMSFLVLKFCVKIYITWVFPDGSDSKDSACNAGHPGLILESGRSPGEGHGNPIQYSCLENFMDRGTWQTTVHGVSKSQT